MKVYTWAPEPLGELEPIEGVCTEAGIAVVCEMIKSNHKFTDGCFDIEWDEKPKPYGEYGVLTYSVKFKWRGYAAIYVNVPREEHTIQHKQTWEFTPYELVDAI